MPRGCTATPPAVGAPDQHRRSGASRPGFPRVDTPSGLVLSAVPPGVLVAGAAIAGPLVGVGVAAAVAVVIATMRIARGHPRGPALGGLVGVAISALVSGSTGWSHTSLFVTDLAWSVAAATVLGASVAVRRPLAGLLWAALHGAPSRLTDPALRRGFDVATATWAAVFGLRALVNDLLIHDPTAPLIVALKIGSGLPLTIVALAVTAWAWRRATARGARTDGASADGAADATRPTTPPEDR